jgi:hypothetical protein
MKVAGLKIINQCGLSDKKNTTLWTYCQYFEKPLESFLSTVKKFQTGSFIYPNLRAC